MNSKKYIIENNQIINRQTNQPIPEDEPVFIFRAHDRKALVALSYYTAILDDLNHIAAVIEVVESFRGFQAAHPDRIKEPDTEPEY